MPSVLQNEDQFALMPVPGLEDAEFSSSRIVAGELIVEPKAKTRAAQCDPSMGRTLLQASKSGEEFRLFSCWSLQFYMEAGFDLKSRFLLAWHVYFQGRLRLS